MHVEFQRFGGLIPALMNRVPRYVADLAPADADRVRSMLPADFYTMSSPGSGASGPDAFRYEVVVQDGGKKQRLAFSETTVPDSLRPLVAFLGAMR